MEHSSPVIKILYSVFLGVLIALFVGFGINTFYPQPKAPEYPSELSYSVQKEPTAEQEAKEKAYQEAMQQFDKEQMAPYNRNVSMIALGAAVLLLIISLIFEKKIPVIADGILFGGVFTLIYSIGRGVASTDTKYIFGIVTVGLIAVIYLGYHKFIKDGHKKTPAATA